MNSNRAASQWKSNKSMQKRFTHHKEDKHCPRVTSWSLNQTKHQWKCCIAAGQSERQCRHYTGHCQWKKENRSTCTSSMCTGSMAIRNWFPVPSNQSSTVGEFLFLMPPSSRLAARSLRAQIKFKNKSQCEQTQRCQGMKASCQPTKAKWVHQRRGQCLFANSK